MRKILLLFLIVTVYIGCTSNASDKVVDNAGIDSALAAKNKAGREMDSAKPVLIGVFQGVIPCADCEGIRTELTLYQDAANSENNTYTLTETYLNTKNKTGDTTFSSTGKWDILRGIKGDATATVYFLNYDEPEEARYFLKKSETTITLLDKEQHVISTALNYSLEKKM
ncbi:MAG: copper resistance protein NlpE [Agriterribacter sp.]